MTKKKGGSSQHFPNQQTVGYPKTDAENGLPLQ